MYLEGLQHDENCFVTLTYHPDNYPTDGSLQPQETQKWIKRLRKKLGDTKIRFFLVGEYGDESDRAHYHCIIFGIGVWAEQIIADTWGLGFVSVGDFNEYTCQYTAGYVVKKLTSKDDPRLNGRHPEFARMSNRPGIGADAMKVIAESIHTDQGLYALEDGDVPKSLKIGKKSIPLGRYLVSKLREQCGMTEKQLKEIKDKHSHEKSQESLDLLRIKLANAKTGEPITTKSAILEENKQALLNFESQYHNRKQRKSL